jgi:hypothetical protein
MLAPSPIDEGKHPPMSAATTPLRSACAALDTLQTAVAGRMQRTLGTRERATLAILLYSLCRGSEALCAGTTPAAAAEAVTINDLVAHGPSPLNAPQPAPAAGLDMPPALTTLPASLSLDGVVLPVERRFSATEFSARRPNCMDRLPVQRDKFSVTAPALRQTNVWQRLRDYKSKDSVRLVTLWETRGSSLSIQASKHGDPSLQWTSRSLNRGGATRGLLDGLVAMSIGGVAAGLSNSAANHPSSQSGGAYAAASMAPAKSLAAAAARSPLTSP